MELISIVRFLAIVVFNLSRLVVVFVLCSDRDVPYGIHDDDLMHKSLSFASFSVPSLRWLRLWNIRRIVVKMQPTNPRRHPMPRTMQPSRNRMISNQLLKPRLKRLSQMILLLERHREMRKRTTSPAAVPEVGFDGVRFGILLYGLL